MANQLELTGVYSATGAATSDNGTYYMRVAQLDPGSDAWNLWSFGVENKNGGSGSGPNFDNPQWSNCFYGTTDGAPKLNSRFEVKYADVALGTNRVIGPITLKVTNTSPVTLERTEGTAGGFHQWVKQSD